MKKTKLIFEMIKLDDDFIVDLRSIFINGFIPNWFELEKFLFHKEDSNLPELIENIESGKTYYIELEIWEDSDDFRSWLDFNIISTELV